MITYYTSLGRMVTKNYNGIKTPVIIVNDSEYELNIDEMIIWGSLHWTFLNKYDLEKEYTKRKENAHIFDDSSFDGTLERLLVRNLVTAGTNYIAADALYDLVGNLKIRPVQIFYSDKIKSCLYMYFYKRCSAKACIRYFFGQKLTKSEKAVLELSKSVGLSAAEIINCSEKNIKKLENEEDLIKKIYDNEEATYKTVNTESRFSNVKIDILQTVANLYLKKKIVFEN